MSSVDIFKSLQQCSFFEALGEEDLHSIADMAHCQHYNTGQLVFSEGEAAEAFFLLCSGLIQAYKIGPDGKEVVLHLVQPGEVFAEYPVFGGLSTYLASALCLEPVTLIAIPSVLFKALVSDKPELLLRMLARFSKRIQEFSVLIEDLTLRSVDSRLAKYLLATSEQSGALCFTLIQKKTLASILGTVPETLSRSFKRLKQQEVIQLQGNALRILDSTLLQQLASQD